MKNKFRVAVVGLGSMGRNHVRVLSSLPNVELVVTCDNDLAKRIDATGRYVESHMQINQSEVDYCVVATPTMSHEAIAVDLIKKGIPVLIEKPAAVNVSGVAAIKEAAQKYSVFVAVGMVERFNQSVIEARDIVKQGEMGELLKISTRRLGWGRHTETGALLDLGIHDLDLIRWVTGDNFGEMTAQFSCEGGIDNVAIAIGKMKSGCLFGLETSFRFPSKLRVLELSFELGTVIVDLVSGEIRVSGLPEKFVERESVREVLGAQTSRQVSWVAKVREPLALEHEAIHQAIATSDWSQLPSLQDAVELALTINFLYSQAQ